MRVRTGEEQEEIPQVRQARGLVRADPDNRNCHGDDVRSKAADIEGNLSPYEQGNDPFIRFTRVTVRAFTKEQALLTQICQPTTGPSGSGPVGTEQLSRRLLRPLTENWAAEGEKLAEGVERKSIVGALSVASACRRRRRRHCRSGVNAQLALSRIPCTHANLHRRECRLRTFPTSSSPSTLPSC